MKKVVVIGGGTGSSVVITALKNLPQLELTALSVVTDSGGSTGRLRDEFGFLPVGDLRQCLVALADDANQKDIRNLLLYRFKKGNGLEGHNLGNLILTALEDIKSSPGEAISLASKIFRIKGKVFPITEVDTNLVITYEDGTKLVGEHFLDDHSKGGKKITSLELTAPAKIYPQAKKAIETADLIIVGPGDLYGSLLPHSLVSGVKDSLIKAKGKFIYIVNLMTHYSQTHELSAQEHVATIEEYFGRKPDYVIVNSEKIRDNILALYENEKEYPVVDDLPINKQIIRAKLVSKVIAMQSEHDKIARSLLRHDYQELTKVLKKIM